MNFEPGRELDKKVGTTVLGLVVFFNDQAQDWFFYKRESPNQHFLLPHFSSNVDDAYVVVNHLQTRGYSCSVNSKEKNNELVWVTTFFKEGTNVVYQGQGITLAHSICQAAMVIHTGNVVALPVKKDQNKGKIIQFPKKPKNDS